MVQIHSDYPTSELELGHPSDNPLPFNHLPSVDTLPSIAIEGIPSDFETMAMVHVMYGNADGLKSHIADPQFSPEHILTVNSKQMTYLDLVVEQRLNLLPRLATPKALLEVCKVFLEHGVKPTQTSLRMAVLYGDNDLFDLLVKHNAVLHGYVLVDAYMLWLSSGKQDYKDIFDKISSKGIAFPEELKFLIHTPPNFFHQ